MHARARAHARALLRVRVLTRARVQYHGPVVFYEAATLDLSSFDVYVWCDSVVDQGERLARVLDLQPTACVVARTRTALAALVEDAQKKWH